MILSSSCGQPISNDAEAFTYCLSRIRTGLNASREGGSTLLSKAEVGGQMILNTFPAVDWHFCSRDCLRNWIGREGPPSEPSA